MKLKRVIMCLLALLGGTVLSPASNANEVRTYHSESLDPRQALFEVGLYELAQGNAHLAVAIFRQLLTYAPTDRVRLELARALFADGAYTESREIFDSLYSRTDIPLPVKVNIKRYLDEIDLVLGSVDFSFSLVSDSNPLNYTRKRQINIAGQSLTLVSPPQDHEIFGMRLQALASRALTPSRKAIAYLDLTFTNYEGNHFDRWDINAGIQWIPQAYPRWRLISGMAAAIVDGQLQYRYPHLGATYFPDIGQPFHLRTGITYGRLDIERANHLDASLLTLEGRLGVQLFREGTLETSLILKRSTAREKPYSYDGIRFNNEFSFPLLADWQAKLTANTSLDSYKAADPFFGKTRNDRKYTLGFSVWSDRFHFSDLVPEVGLLYENTCSSIDYYTYDKLGFVLTFRER